jgi:prophage antirepressor-like protein
MDLTKIFTFDEKVVLRSSLTDDVLLFALTDMAKFLGYRDAANAAYILDEDEKGYLNLSTLGGEQTVLGATKEGVLHLTFASKRQEAKVFRKWLLDEVLPSIWNQGSYVDVARLARAAYNLTNSQANTYIKASTNYPAIWSARRALIKDPQASDEEIKAHGERSMVTDDSFTLLDGRVLLVDGSRLIDPAMNALKVPKVDRPQIELLGT